MDTSEKYIKMCEKAEEIQILWKSKEGDFYWYFSDDDPNIGHDAVVDRLDLDWLDDGDKWFENQCWWLPRQDQLQEMIYNPANLNAVCAMFEEISEFGWSFPYTDNSGKTNGIELNSGEQLWLAFVMKEKFNKTWNDEKEEWIAT